MKILKNARFTFTRRLEMVHDVLEHGPTLVATAARHGVSVPTVRKWAARFLAQGEAALRDRFSRPARSPRAIAATTAAPIVELRRRRLTQSRIARSVGVSATTMSRVLTRAGFSRLAESGARKALVRYEHARPGDLLRIDTQKLGRIERMGHRITGNPRDNTNGAGWEFLFVAVDDHARISSPN